MTMIELRPWAEEDLLLLTKLNEPEMTQHLGGPESEEQLLRRHRRYVEAAALPVVRVFKIVLVPLSVPVGAVVYWERSWHGQLVWESGWGVLPAYQGQGIASKAVALLVEKARSERKRQFLHAFPSISNAASNAICRKLGFLMIEECDFEYPPGHFMRCNDWCLDLFEEPAQARGQRDKQESDLPIELAKPARRALEGASYFRLEQLTRVSEAELKQLHLNNHDIVHTRRLTTSCTV